MTPIEEISPLGAEEFAREIRPHFRPVVIRGAARDWPLVQEGLNSAERALSMIERLDQGAPTDIMVAPPSEKGRFFYAANMPALNFRRQRGSLSELVRTLRSLADDPAPPAMYAGATDLRSNMPGFAEQHPLPLSDSLGDATPRIWLGNASEIATHFDLSDNFAVVAAGRRRFTLFPPDAVANLYVGPLDVTLAGQPVSMVDPLAPDLDRYPLFQNASEQALYAELEPGDAIYIPTLWWHHVAASAPINILVNYWHNDARQGGGFLALVHAILAIRDRPLPERTAWRAWFEHMVFGPDAPDSAAHLPPHAQGVAGPPSPERDAKMRRFIAQVIVSP